jgi:nucleotide-binding universal stress UspA family protein
MKTIKIKKVLIAVDYDPSAQKVTELGYSLAQNLGAEVILLHVVANATYYSALEYSQVTGFAGYIDKNLLYLDSEDALKKISQQFLDKTKQHLGDNTITTLVKEGDFADSILEAANELLADIIVMGSHSRKWLENILMGRVTEKVLHRTTIPLFIIPTKKPN